MLLVDVDAVAPLPGLGEVGGLLTVLLASLKSSDQESVGHSYTQQRKPPLTISRMYFLFLLAVPHGMRDLASLLRGGARAPCSGNVEPYPLDHGGSPHTTFSSQLCSSIPCPFFLEYHFYCFLILKVNRWYMSNFRKIRKQNLLMIYNPTM